jgi:N utilization substance protein A
LNMTTEITFTEETLRYITLFENMTKARVRDCMETEDKLVYVVDPGQANRAVGKGGENVIRLKNTTGKNIQVVEFSDDAETFIKNVFYNYGPEKVEIETRGTIVHATVTVDPAVKGRAIGKNGKNLKIARDLVNRHHNVQSISVA